jgi:UDP-hydrolysing UDP-N-acetyl-D-glucosamine 2-epimerase
LEGLTPAECISRVNIEIASFDLMLILGDRYESLAAALAATVAKKPIAHIHGGEASFGSFDNQIRDAISKLAHIHFVANGKYAARLRDIGEHKDRIHVVGAPGLDNLVELEERKPERYFVVTYHPPTLHNSDGIKELMLALTRFPKYTVIWTGANNDPDGDYINGFVAAWGEVRRDLSLNEYISLARNAAAIVGNSSSGIIEAPVLEVPTVNIGPRQDGRLKGPSIFDCEEDLVDIRNTIKRALEYKGPYHSLYGEPGASEKIANILAETEIDMVKTWRS